MQENHETTFLQLMIAVAKRAMMRSTYALSLSPEGQTFLQLPPPLQKILTVMHENFCVKKWMGNALYFDPTNINHLGAVAQLRKLIGLPAHTVPSLSTYCSLALFKKKKKNNREAAYVVENERNVFFQYQMGKQLICNTDSSYFNLTWTQQFPELFSDLNNPDWFHRYSCETRIREITVGVFGGSIGTRKEEQFFYIFPSHKNNIATLITLLNAVETGGFVSALTDTQLSQCLTAVFLEGSKEHIIAFAQLCTALVKKNILQKIYSQQSMVSGDFTYSPLLLLCLRNIFDENLFEMIYSDKAPTGTIFRLHENITPFSAACYHGNTALLEWLTKKGETQEVNCVDHAIRGKQKEVCEYLVRDLGKKLTDISVLAQHFTPELYEFLKEHQAITPEQIQQFQKLYPHAVWDCGMEKSATEMLPMRKKT